jgi:hypothetical protein
MIISREVYVFFSFIFNFLYIKIPAPIISAIINTPIKIGAIACTRNTIIAIMIIRVITAITKAPTTLSVTPPNPPGIPNRYYLTLYAF